jgi:hypothetical protein
MTVSMDEFFSATAVPEDPLRDELIRLIRARDAATPRHRQRELGPSEVGHPCMRKMAFGMMEVPRCNPQWDPLPSIIGTATHKWLESAAKLANQTLGRQRWKVETRVNVAPGLSGSADLYDHDTRTVIDWKIPGDNRFKMYVKEMSPVFRNQVQMYGLGFTNAGLPVDTVAVALLHRGGTLTGMHLWKEPYMPQVAQAALARREAVMLMLNDLRVDIDPARYQWIPAEPYDCMFCPWFKPDPKTPLQCGGKK